MRCLFLGGLGALLLLLSAALLVSQYDDCKRSTNPVLPLAAS